jgi:molybdopterin-guanine dinucleotide biosynthesis protein A
MSRAGFVLVGGRSSRMGRDKARLPFRNGMLVEHIAAEVEKAAGSVWLVGAPERYRDLPFRTIPDVYVGGGPAGGIHAALAASPAEWNLIVACDLPALEAGFLIGLLEEAERAGRPGLVPVSPDGRWQPLCAVYHRSCLAGFEQALRDGRFKLHGIVAELGLHAWPVTDARWFRNLNTPEDWAAITGA